ncbi:MAG: NHL repeat-containing protein [Planctomycetota bacterium]|jgi:hypothetical protein
MARRLVIALVCLVFCVPFFVRAEDPVLTVSVNFDELPPGPIGEEGTLITVPVFEGEVPVGDLTIRIRRSGDPLEVNTIGVPGWGSGSLSLFHLDPGAPNGAPLEVEIVSVPPTYGVETVSCQIGDFEPSDIDDCFTSTTAGFGVPLEGTIALTPDQYDEPFVHPTFRSATIRRQRAMGIQLFHIWGGSYNFPGSVYIDNFTFVLRQTEDRVNPFGTFAAGSDLPESDFGGDPINDQFSTNSGRGGEVEAVVYGVDAHNETLFTLDLETGDRTYAPNKLGANVSTPTGMAIRPSDGAIYIWNNYGGGGTDNSAGRGLYTVDPETGIATLVATSSIAMEGLAFDPGGVLYGRIPQLPNSGQGQGPGPLAYVDLVTAELTPVSQANPPVQLPRFTALDYRAADGDLYAITLNYVLLRIDPELGALINARPLVIEVPGLGFVPATADPELPGYVPGSPRALFFDAAGGLHAGTLNNTEPPGVLFDINPTTGVISNVSSSVDPFGALATTGGAATPVGTQVPPTVTLLLNGKPFSPDGAVEWVNGKTIELVVNGRDDNFKDEVTVGGSYNGTEIGTSGTGPTLSAQVGSNCGQRVFQWTPYDQVGPQNFSFRAASNGEQDVLGLTLTFPAAGQGDDTDGDGLLDVWETDGYDFERADGTIVHVDLPGMGADPYVKDLFIVLDYMVGTAINSKEKLMVYDHRPTDAAIQLIKDAFTPPAGDPREGKHDDVKMHVLVRHKLDANGAIIPDPNGDPQPRIDFAVQLGQILGGNYVWTAPTGDAATHYDDIKEQYFAPELRQAVLHGIFCHSIGGLYTGMARGAPESDFVVSLGDLLDYRSAAEGLEENSVVKPTTWEQAGTFMHEVGHCLGLHHGGDKIEFFKPNYLSVMNLPFQLSGLRFDGADGLFDYSFVKLEDLDEENLDENNGLKAPVGVDISRYGTTWFFRPATTDAARVQRWTSAAAGKVNWYVDSIVDPSNPDHIDSNVKVDLNKTGSKTILKGYNDWANLNFLGGVKGTGVQLPRPATSPAEGLTVPIATSLQSAGFDELYLHHAKGKNVLTWSAGGAKATYNIYRSTNGGEMELLATTTKSNYQDTAINADDTYAYDVRIVDANGREGGGPDIIIETPKK